MEKVRKHNKNILMIWIGTIAVVALSWGAVWCDNARQGQGEAREVAIQTLRNVAERVINREFDKLEMCYVFKSDDGKKYAKRKSISETGELEVEVDSLKEARGLFPLETLGGKANMLNNCGKFPLEKICLEWEDEMNVRYGRVACALFLKVNPLGKAVCQESFAGEESVRALQYDLGTYYLDGMYTMKLTAYMQLDFRRYVDWTDSLLRLLSVFFLLVLLAGLVFYVRLRMHKEEETPKVPETVFRFGEYIFDAVCHTLIHEEGTMNCTPQAAKLLLGFAKAPDFFLTNDEIAAICGWHLEDLNLDARRRKAISLLKKMFKADGSVQICFVPEREGYQIVISI
ncbi:MULTISPECIES: DNA-binding response regulator [unclassified Bacteroides]|jgi:DNA-binding winged helix-turn-helix (wHTH) protein|uniref:winged helix-turn-helix domain-containing protein n=1 Tax=unclassified Bacteroides TaxID=2646097 RepID=UPI001595F67C|nr:MULTISPECIES: DNA-binding response regulator [unclassified Bacteroides]NVK94901.1 DNA-binding response regulator [Bacteroides sp. L10-4]